MERKMQRQSWRERDTGEIGSKGGRASRVKENEIDTERERKRVTVTQTESEKLGQGRDCKRV